MKILLKPMLAAGLALAAFSPLAEAPAFAQTIKGLGIIDLNAVIAGTSAYKTAEEQRPVTYKAQYDQVQVRTQAIQQQVAPLVAKLQADSQVENADAEALQQQVAALQQIDQLAQREIQQIMAPVIMSQDYVGEQINGVLAQAVDSVVKSKNLSLVLRRNAESIIYRDPSYVLDQDVINEVNKLLPMAQLVPPPGWLPLELRQQQAAREAAAQRQAAAAGTAPAPAASAGPAVNGR